MSSNPLLSIGTSEWSARQIEEAHHVAADLKLIPPVVEQVQYKFVHIYLSLRSGI
jgi:aryl-alcohol dehydrogenase-like predicted oxidoreductase